MIRSRPVLMLVAAIALAGCAKFDVKARRDPNVDMSHMRTYAWLPIEQAAPADQRVQDRYMDRRLREDVATDFAAKGYRPAESGQQPDFLLNYRLATDPVGSVRSNPQAYWGDIWWANWTPGDSAYYSDNYDVGTLYIAALDPSSKKIIWLGMAQARLVPTMSLERKTARLDDAVKQILARFPNG